MTAQGHPRAIFKRAIERGNYLVAVTTAREVGRLDLGDALELLNLIALHEPALYAAPPAAGSHGCSTSART